MGLQPFKSDASLYVLSARASETLGKHLNVHLGDYSFFENGLTCLLTTSRQIQDTPETYIFKMFTPSIPTVC